MEEKDGEDGCEEERKGDEKRPYICDERTGCEDERTREARRREGEAVSKCVSRMRNEEWGMRNHNTESDREGERRPDAQADGRAPKQGKKVERESG